jgi:transcriptional regulator with XRE-family HTH domain
MGQGELGKLLGLSFQQVQKYEKGTNRIGAGLLPHVAKALGVAITYFYEGIEPGLPSAEPRSAEEESARLVMEFVSSNEGTQLIRALMKIRDTKIRKRVLNLMRELAQEGSVEPDRE